MSMWIPTTEFKEAKEPYILIMGWDGGLRLVERASIKDATMAGPYFIGVDPPPIRKPIILEDKSYGRTGPCDRDTVDDV